jgi:succinoglycan biosynthesis transport protein ExoP
VPPADAPEYPDLPRIVASARRWWWALLVAALLGAAVGMSAGGSSVASYQASTRLLVESVGEQFSVLRAAGQQAETYADLATSQPVLAGARVRLLRLPTLAQLQADVGASADDVTRLLTITARGDTPNSAAATANAVAEELQSRTSGDIAGSPHRLSVVEPAQPPGRADDGGSGALVAIAALAGLLGALTLVVLIDLVRGRVASEGELAAASPAPVLGTAGRGGAGLLGAASLLGARHQRVAVAGIDDDGTGARVALELASALATGGDRVVLVDADPGPRGLTARLRLGQRPGLGEALARPRTSRHDAVELAAMTVACAPGVALLPCGHGPLGTDDPDPLLEQLRAVADVVVISAPPAVVSGATLRGWGRRSGGAVLAVRDGHATRDRVAGTVELLSRSGTTVLGTVLTRRPRRRLPSLHPGDGTPVRGRRRAFAPAAAPSATDGVHPT